MTFKNLIIAAFLMVFTLSLKAQSVGDTIKIKTFTYDSGSRQMLVDFPDDPNQSFEKIILKYSMRCKDGLVSDPSNRNKGCGEWDFTNNTYIIDPNNTTDVLNQTKNLIITNHNPLSDPFPYMKDPVYDYYRSEQTNTVITNTTNETSSVVGTGNESLTKTLATSQLGGKSQYLYTAAELVAGGMTAGNIDRLSLNVLGASGEAQFLKIKIKETSKTFLDGIIDMDGFTEVFYENTTLSASQINGFQFKTPFLWDGTSNILVEFSFTNLKASSLTTTEVEGSTTTSNMGAIATSENNHMFLKNYDFIEVPGYKGIAGGQSRTLETWIKTKPGETASLSIAGWGVSSVNAQRSNFRVWNGKLRYEVNGGFTAGSSLVNDGEWHHIALVIDGSGATTTLANVSFYIDGVLDTISAPSTSNINTNTTDGVDFRIGGNSSPTAAQFFQNGHIDQFRLWDTNLTASEINQWMRLTLDNSHPQYANLQLYYDFEDTDDGQSVRDASGNNRHGEMFKTIRTSFKDGENMFKEFIFENNKPNITFYQGDYVVTSTQTSADKPVEKDLQHFIMEKTIEDNSALGLSDEIIVSSPYEVWKTEENIYNGNTGALIVSNSFTPDNTLQAVELQYYKRESPIVEIVSFITPYGINLDFGIDGESWLIDLSDFATLLKGQKSLIMPLEGKYQEQVDLEFLFVVGTPPREVLQFQQIWQSTKNEKHTYSKILSDNHLPPTSFDFNSNASSFKLRSSITGHGPEGEFHQNGGTVEHKILIDSKEIHNWTITQVCGENPIYPQGGSWIYDRQGWCPGEQTHLEEVDITSHVTPGTTVTFDYDVFGAVNSDGNYKYHMSHAIVGYGSANHNLDASIVDVLNPSKKIINNRLGSPCADPKIVIQNRGATTLTSATISYWVNDAMTPQTYNWTGNLAFMEKEEVSLPYNAVMWQDLQGNNNNFYAEISLPNGGADEYAYNNRYSSGIEIPIVFPTTVMIAVNTNRAPEENRYDIIDAATGDVVGSNELTAAQTVTNDEYNLPNSCYRFIIYDSGNNGLFNLYSNDGSGYQGYTAGFQIVDYAADPPIKLSEDFKRADSYGTINDFGSIYSFDFTTDFALSVEELDFVTNLKLYPNPTEEYAFVKSNSPIKPQDVTIYNISGQKINVPILNDGSKELKLQVSNLATGTYFVIVQNNNIKTTRKLIKN